MRQITASLIFAVLLAGCDSPTQPGSVGTIPARPAMLRQHFGAVILEPIVGDLLDNPCTGKVVTLTGEFLHRFNGVGPDPLSGQFTNFEDFFKISGTGIDESGNQYIFNNVEHVVFDTPRLPPTQLTFTAENEFVLVSKGGASNFTGHMIIHVTILPDGSTKVTTDFDRAECRG